MWVLKIIRETKLAILLYPRYNNSVLDEHSNTKRKITNNEDLMNIAKFWKPKITQVYQRSIKEKRRRLTKEIFGVKR